MNKFESVKSRVVCFPAENINTDQIIPARFLKRIERGGWGDFLFADMKPAELFGLADASSRKIMICGPNFGSGSSREHAVWAVRDFGFRALISTSFADIFKENCLKNGVLTVTLDDGSYQRLFESASKSPDAEMTVDLQAKRISFPGALDFSFDMNSFNRTCLLEGLDELGYIMRNESTIKAFEQAVR
jgi:3-isopropylmalate/(R)-2-methylmalate dehydratase small subunit